MANEVAQRLMNACKHGCPCSTPVTDEEIATYGEAGLVAFARKVAQGCGCKQGSGSLIGHMLLADCASDPTEHIPFKKPT